VRMGWRVSSVTWSQLARLQRSFGAKAAIALPLVALAIAAVPYEWAQGHLVANWRLHVVFWGSLFFLAGQAMIRWRRPIEFARDLELQAEISDLKAMSNFATFQNRVEMLGRLVERFKLSPPWGFKPAIVQIAVLRLKEAREATKENWEAMFPLIVVSQRALREYDCPRSRVAAVLLLGTGTTFLLLPTLVNVGIAACALLRVYVGFLL
jgi:hypothetical protein